MDALGFRLEYILYHTLEQNNFVEPFQKTQEGVHPVQRLSEPPGGRDGDQGNVRQLQPAQDLFVARTPRANRVLRHVEEGQNHRESEGEQLTMETMRLEGPEMHLKGRVHSRYSENPSITTSNLLSPNAEKSSQSST